MKTVIITGATSGIGLETALKLTGKGYFVIGVGHSRENCDRAIEQILKRNPEAKTVYFSGELMQQRELKRVAQELERYLAENCNGEL